MRTFTWTFLNRLPRLSAITILGLGAFCAPKAPSQKSGRFFKLTDLFRFYRDFFAQSSWSPHPLGARRPLRATEMFSPSPIHLSRFPPVQRSSLWKPSVDFFLPRIRFSGRQIRGIGIPSHLLLVAVLCSGVLCCLCLCSVSEGVQGLGAKIPM